MTAHARQELRVIDGGGQPEQDRDWLNHGTDAEATRARVDREQRLRDERRAALEARSQTVYLLYDADDALLYVGISVNGPARLAQHSGVQDWWTAVARAEFEHYPDRSAAETRELDLIRERDPRWNVMGKTA